MNLETQGNALSLGEEIHEMREEMKRMRVEIERMKEEKEEKKEEKKEALLLGDNITKAIETLVALERENFDEEGIFLFVRKGGVVSSEVFENALIGGSSKVYKKVDLNDVQFKEPQQLEKLKKTVDESGDQENLPPNVENSKKEVEEQVQQMTLEDKSQQKQKEILPTKPLPELIGDINSSIFETRLEALRQIRKLLAQEKSLIQEVIGMRFLHRLISFLGPLFWNEKGEALQIEVAWVLATITSGSIWHTKAVVKAGAIPMLVNLLSTTKNVEIQEPVTYTLGLIAADERDLVLEAGAMVPILDCLVDCENVTLIGKGIWTIASLCRGKTSPELELVSPSIPTLARFLSVPDVEILADACWALAHITDGWDSRIEAVLKEESIVPQLVELLDHENSTVQIPAIRTIGNIVTGTDAHTQVVVDCPMALPLLKKLLHDPKPLMRKEGCWVISNIVASEEQIQKVIDAGVVPLVAAMIISNEEMEEIKTEAVHVLGNVLTGGSVDQIVYVVEQNVIPGFLSYLGNRDSDGVRVCLDGIKKILKVGEDSNRFGEVNPFVEKMMKCEDFDKFKDLQFVAARSWRVERMLKRYFE